MLRPSPRSGARLCLAWLPRALSVGIAVVSLVVAGPAGASPAEPVPVLFEPAPPMDPPEVAAMASSSTTVGSELPVRLDPRVLASNPDRLALEMPDGSRHQLVRVRWSSEGEIAAWYGVVDTGRVATQPVGPVREALDGYALLSYIEGRVRGTVRAPDGHHYDLRPGSSPGVYRLRKLQSRGRSGCGVDGSGDGSARRPAAPSAPVGDKSSHSCQLDPLRPLVRIDLLTLYSPAFVGSLQGADEDDARDSIIHDVDQANMVHANSGTRIVYDIVHMGPVTAHETLARPRVDVMRAAEDLGAERYSEINRMRLDYGADMVTLMVPDGGDTPCGSAVTPHKPGTVEVQQSWGGAFDDQAFMAYQYGCGAADYTFAHELGHTFGMQHDRNDPKRSMTPVKPYAYGYLFSGGTGTNHRGATVMGCDMESDISGVCSRIPFFSHPGKSPNGVAIGEGTNEPNGGSFNACLAYDRAVRYAGFESSGGNAVPTVQITAPMANTYQDIQQTIFLQAAASDAEDGVLSANIQWRSDLDGSLGSGPNLTWTSGSAGPHLLTASVTDSSGKTAQHSIRFTIADNSPPQRWIDVPAHNQVLSGTGAWIRGWATDASGVQFVRFYLDGQQLSLRELSEINTSTGRSDVCNAYSSLEDPDCPFVGWQARLDTTGFPDGIHQLQVTATDTEQNTSTTVSRQFRIRNTVTASFPAVADAFVYQLFPSGNYGQSGLLYVRNEAGGFGLHSYLKFSVSGVTAPIQKATLRLRTGPNAIPSGLCYRLATTGWGETTITWSNAPRDSLGNVSLGSMPANTWIERDVTHLVSGNGTYTFGCTAYDQAGQYFRSRESSSPPILILEY